MSSADLIFRLFGKRGYAVFSIDDMGTPGSFQKHLFLASKDLVLLFKANQGKIRSKISARIKCAKIHDYSYFWNCF